MIYLKCPSCGYVLGNRQKLYDMGLEEIESNPNNDEETKLDLKTKLIESLKIKNSLITLFKYPKISPF